MVRPGDASHGETRPSPELESRRKPLRVLRVSTDTYPDVLGGGALHAHEMSRVQAGMGHDVTVLTSDHGDRDRPRTEDRAGYEIRRYRQFGRPFGNSITPGIVRDISALTEEYDVVHAHSHLYFSTNVAAALARRNDVPLVVTNHGLHSQTAPMLVQKAFAPVARFTFNAADRVLCYTDTDERRLRERGIDAPISVVRNGIDCETFTPEAADTERPQVLFVGRLKRTKGPQRLLRAFDDAMEAVPTATLTFVGDGPLRSDLEALATELGRRERVTFTGRLENGALPRLYAESAVFALPSTTEGFPRTVLEAMACGTPVVTSDLPQLEPVVEQHGTTVPLEGIDELGNALRELLHDDRTRADLGRAARQHVVDQYSWLGTVRETTDVYHELLE
jgi:glycosyltransferase involved in cell wall biosynthesis